MACPLLPELGYPAPVFEPAVAGAAALPQRALLADGLARLTQR
jgi:hypothetical protein